MARMMIWMDDKKNIRFMGSDTSTDLAIQTIKEKGYTGKITVYEYTGDIRAFEDAMHKWGNQFSLMISLDYIPIDEEDLKKKNIITIGDSKKVVDTKDIEKKYIVFINGKAIFYVGNDLIDAKNAFNDAEDAYAEHEDWLEAGIYLAEYKGDPKKYAIIKTDFDKSTEGKVLKSLITDYDVDWTDLSIKKETLGIF